MSDKKTYDKIESNKLREIKERLCENIGRCDHMAKEGNHEEAYDKLREEIDLFLDEMNKNQEFHSE